MSLPVAKKIIAHGWRTLVAEGESNGRRLIRLRNRRGGSGRTRPAFERHLREKGAREGAAPPLSANRGARAIELSAASSLAAGGGSSTDDEASATFRATSSGLTAADGLLIGYR